MTAAKDSPSRSCSATCLTCLTSLDYQYAPRPGTLQDPGEITAGTALAEAGVDLAVIQALMGHEHVDAVAAYAVSYTHLTLPTKRIV